MRFIFKKIIIPLAAILLLIFLIWKKNAGISEKSPKIVKQKSSDTPLQSKQKQIPENVIQVLQYILLNGIAPDGYVGGKRFYNREKKLPELNLKNQKATYSEWDVHPKQKNTDRGTERIVISNDSTAWYTADHYNTFIKINAP